MTSSQMPRPPATAYANYAELPAAGAKHVKGFPASMQGRSGLSSFSNPGSPRTTASFAAQFAAAQKPAAPQPPLLRITAPPTTQFTIRKDNPTPSPPVPSPPAPSPPAPPSPTSAAVRAAPTGGRITPAASATLMRLLEPSEQDTSASAQAGPAAAFVSAARFGGVRPGAVFKLGPQGQGYYADGVGGGGAGGSRRPSIGGPSPGGERAGTADPLKRSVRFEPGLPPPSAQPTDPRKYHARALTEILARRQQQAMHGGAGEHMMMMMHGGGSPTPNYPPGLGYSGGAPAGYSVGRGLSYSL